MSDFAELLSPERFSQLFDPPLGRTRLYERVKSGAIRSVRLGSRLYIPRSEIARLAGELANGDGHHSVAALGDGDRAAETSR